MTTKEKIAKAKKRVEAMRPGWFLVWRSLDKHRVGQVGRMQKHRAKASKKKALTDDR